MAIKPDKIIKNHEDAARIAYERSIDQIIHPASRIIENYLFMCEKGYEIGLIDGAIADCDFLESGAKGLKEIINERAEDYKSALDDVLKYTDEVRKLFKKYKLTKELPAEIIPYLEGILKTGSSMLHGKVIESWERDGIVLEESEKWRGLCDKFTKKFKSEETASYIT